MLTTTATVKLHPASPCQTEVTEDTLPEFPGLVEWAGEVDAIEGLFGVTIADELADRLAEADPRALVVDPKLGLWAYHGDAWWLTMHHGRQADGTLVVHQIAISPEDLNEEMAR